MARTDGEGHRWQYRYDKDTLQLTEVINPQGESYLYVLDNCGRVTEERDWGGVVWRYRYDADGLCTAGLTAGGNHPLQPGRRRPPGRNHHAGRQNAVCV